MGHSKIVRIGHQHVKLGKFCIYVLIHLLTYNLTKTERPQSLHKIGVQI